MERETWKKRNKGEGGAGVGDRLYRDNGGC